MLVSGDYSCYYYFLLEDQSAKTNFKWITLVLQSDFQLKLIGKDLHGSQLEFPERRSTSSALETVSS